MRQLQGKLEIDDFCKIFIPLWNRKLLQNKEIKRIRKDCPAESDIILYTRRQHSDSFNSV
jgi:hypothetical protein